MSEPKRYDDVIGMLTDQCHQYAVENARLKAEVERLTKAGDAMSDQLLCDYGDNPLTYAWNAAKEGKQP